MSSMAWGRPWTGRSAPSPTPVDGGFFRYAETRDWQVPHYEKMADLNAGAALVLSRLDRLSSDPVRAQARKRTIEYLQSTLYEPARGAFLSFQEADTRYFLLDADDRATRPAPAVAGKIFTDRLAGTLDHLFGVLPWSNDPALERQVTQSLEFLASMVEGRERLQRFYRLDSAEWETDSLLRDHALVALVFQKASRHYSEPRYARIGQAVVESAIDRFHDAERGILVDPSFDDDDSIEYLMEMNAMLGLAMMRLEEGRIPAATGRRGITDDLFLGRRYAARRAAVGIERLGGHGGLRAVPRSDRHFRGAQSRWRMTSRLHISSPHAHSR